MKGAPLQDIAFVGAQEFDDDKTVRASGFEQTACSGIFVGSSDATSDTSQNTVSATVLQAIAK
jgi:hypothetical protein